MKLNADRFPFWVRLTHRTTPFKPTQIWGFVNKGRGGRGAGVRPRSGPVQALTPAIETEKVVLTLVNQ